MSDDTNTPAAGQQTRTTEELRKMLHVHVRYEVNMLQKSAAAIGRGSWLNHAVLESFLLHVRNLQDFFDPRPSSGDRDVLAVQFFRDSATWPDAFSKAMPLTKLGNHGWRYYLDKHLAHITWKRIDEELTPDFEWQFGAMCKDLTDIWVTFRTLSEQDRPELWVDFDKPPAPA